MIFHSKLVVTRLRYVKDGPKIGVGQPSRQMGKLTWWWCCFGTQIPAVVRIRRFFALDPERKWDERGILKTSQQCKIRVGMISVTDWRVTFLNLLWWWLAGMMLFVCVEVMTMIVRSFVFALLPFPTSFSLLSRALSALDCRFLRL